ncbi:MAG: hypothetical protein KA297_05735 [Kofleriaceae bacterium]|nr:hypothetical protein [Kofleriaceae bacterium]MBP6839594.1 hypothetical protein [Kofleriaceae bacterium]
MLLGEILVADGLVLAGHLERALTAQRRSGQRLGSILVAAGMVTADGLARALARQHGVPAALEKHLAARDVRLTGRLPAELARRWLALPVARGRDGTIVVCLRDPSPAALSALATALGAPVTPAVACELVLRRHVEQAYPARAAGEAGDEFEVDLESGVHVQFDLDDAAEELLAEIHAPALAVGAGAEADDDGLADGVAVLASGQFELVSLDHAQVARRDVQAEPTGLTHDRARVSADGRAAARPPRVDPHAATALAGAAALAETALVAAAAPTAPAAAAVATPARSTPTASIDALDEAWTLPEEAAGSSGPAIRTSTRRPPDTLELEAMAGADPTPASVPATIAGLGLARARDEVADLLLAAAFGRFAAVIVLLVRDGLALGHRGAGPGITPTTVDALSVPLSTPSLLKTVIDNRQPYLGRIPAGGSTIQDRFFRLLPTTPAVLLHPIALGNRVVALVVAGARDVETARREATALAPVLAACAEAYTRLIRASKQSSQRPVRP